MLWTMDQISSATSVTYLHRLLLVSWPGRDGRLSPARCHTVTNAILIYNGVKFNVNAICCHNMLDDKYCCFIVFISCVYAFVRMIVRQFFLMNKDSYIRRRHSRPPRLWASGSKDMKPGEEFRLMSLAILRYFEYVIITHSHVFEHLL